jgi:protein involved in ribonucleotide reduction
VFLRNIEKVDEPFVLVTYTDKFGEVPITTQNFLSNNHELLLGVSASGNRRWHDTYCMAADVISKQYAVPIISKFELSGNKDDVNTFKSFIEGIDQFGNTGETTRGYELLRA